MALTHGSVWAAFLQAVGFGVWMFCQQLSAMQTEELERLLVAAFLDAMHAANLTLKEMAYGMGIDESLLRRQLARKDGNAHLSLFRLMRAPASWWLYFGPALLHIVVKRETHRLLDEVIEDVRRRT